LAAHFLGIWVNFDVIAKKSVGKGAGIINQEAEEAIPKSFLCLRFRASHPLGCKTLP
jgi:hypothetical protein